MINFKLNNKNYEIPASWEDVTLQKYLDLCRLDRMKKDFDIDEMYLISLINVLSGAQPGELDDLPLTALGQITEKLKWAINAPDFPNKRIINLDGNDYTYPADFNKLTTGEYISMKSYEKKYEDRPEEALPYLMAILLRPCRDVINEKGEKEIDVDKFDSSKVNEMKEFLMDKSIWDLMGPVNFFLNGREPSKKTTKSSTKGKKKVTKDSKGLVKK